MQPPTPWARPSAPARWLWHVRMGGGHTLGDRDAAPRGESRCQTCTPGLGTRQSRSFDLHSPHLQETGTFERGHDGFARALPASLSPHVVLPSPRSSSALPLAGHPAHPVCPLAGLPGRPGTPEIPQKYKNTVLVLWKPADSKAPCTYTLERRLDGTWGCLPSPGSRRWKDGVTGGHQARTKVPNVLAVPWGPMSGWGTRDCPWSAPT